MGASHGNILPWNTQYTYLLVATHDFMIKLMSSIGPINIMLQQVWVDYNTIFKLPFWLSILSQSINIHIFHLKNFHSFSIANFVENIFKEKSQYWLRCFFFVIQVIDRDQNTQRNNKIMICIEKQILKLYKWHFKTQYIIT